MSDTIKGRMKTIRRAYPMQVAGQTFHGRALTLGELDEVEKHADAAAPAGSTDKVVKAARAAAFGTALFVAGFCDEGGAAVYTGTEDPGLQDIPTDLFRDLIEGVAALNNLKDEGDQGND